MGLPIVEGLQIDFSKLRYISVAENCLNLFMFLKMVLIKAISADSDEMQHYAAFHLGLHCLPKYPFRSFMRTKG